MKKPNRTISRVVVWSPVAAVIIVMILLFRTVLGMINHTAEQAERLGHPGVSRSTDGSGTRTL